MLKIEHLKEEVKDYTYNNTLDKETIEVVLPYRERIHYIYYSGCEDKDWYKNRKTYKDTRYTKSLEVFENKLCTSANKKKYSINNRDWELTKYEIKGNDKILTFTIYKYTYAKRKEVT